MYNIKTMNKIAPVGLERLPAERYLTGDGVENEDAILVRSAKLHDYVFPEKLWAIARAGAGVNNIPVERCSEAGVVVFNTPGANANAVKELVLCAMLLASRDVIGGAAWVKEQARAGDVDVAAAVEKGKSAFVGPELYRKTLGVVGLGAIGALVANIGLSLGMDVYGYDPYLSVDAALRLDRHIKVVKELDTLYASSDYITLHLPYMEATKDTVNAAAIAKMKDGVILVNCSRGELADLEALVEGIESEKLGALGMDTSEGEEGIIHEDHRVDILANRNWFYLHQFRNVIMTQHMAFYTDAAVESMVDCGIRGICRMAAGERFVTEL